MPMHVLNLILKSKGMSFCVFKLAWSQFHDMPCSVAVSAHSPFNWKWLMFFFYVALECQFFFRSDFEVMNGHGIENKEVNSK
jgi:hypothetical protein